MSIVKSVFTEVNSHPIGIVFPEKKTLILRGRNNLQILHIIECLLSKDFTEYYRVIDRQYGLLYEEPTGTSQLTFNNSAILGREGRIFVQGRVPNIHCVRYLGVGEKLRSFYISQDDTYSKIYTDMTKYSGVINDNTWVRLISLVNDIVGEEIVTFDGKKLMFKFIEDYDISIEGQQLIYMIVAECFLTPDDYVRVVLLPDIPFLSAEVQVKLLSVLDNISKHTLTLSTANVTIQDLKDAQAISIINV